MNKADVYAYGMVLVSNSFLLKDDYPKADTYSEIKEKYKYPGGETGTCATVLDSLGVSVKMDGTFLGRGTAEITRKFYSSKKVDITSMTEDKTYDGLEDYVLIGKDTRTPFGMFGSFYSDANHRWSAPKAEDIVDAKAAAIDPYFGNDSEEAAKICVKNNIPYVTIDCDPESYLHEHSAISIISGEYILNSCKPGTKREELFPKFISKGKGLTIITHGSHEILYGRSSTGLNKFSPFKIKTVSTLGAGDTFKAGCVYALLKHMDDKQAVLFASACSAVACSRFPFQLNPPKLTEVEKMISFRIE